MMATTAESASKGASRNHWPWIEGGARLAIATLGAVASVAAAVVGWHGGAANTLGWLVLAVVWLTAAFVIHADHARRGAERTQMLAVVLTLTVATEVVVLASMLHVLVGWPPRLFQVYGEGNFIESTADTPYFQIGESKYGKPVIDRVITRATSLSAATKCILVSFDSTMRSNISVGLPIDLVSYEAGALRIKMQRRIDESDPYFRMVHEQWGEGLRRVFADLPDPNWA